MASVDRVKKTAAIYAAGTATRNARLLLDGGAVNQRYDNDLTALMWARLWA